MSRSTKLLILACVVSLSLAAIVPTTSAGPHYFSTTRIVSNPVTGPGQGAIRCPAGTSLTGGGAYPLPDNEYERYDSYEYVLTASFASGRTWTGEAMETHGTYSGGSWTYHTEPYTPRVFAICAS